MNGSRISYITVLTSLGQSEKINEAAMVTKAKLKPFIGKWVIDEMDPASGRGCAVIENGELRGRIFIHLGDDSMFRARRA